MVISKTEKDKIKKEIIKEVNQHLREEIFRFIQGVGKEVILEELKKIDIPDYLTERMNTLFRQKFEPIIQSAVNLSAQKVSGKINTQLKSVINLKTSTISEVQEEIRKIPAETEEETLRQLSSDFPEYYQAIEEQKKLEGTKE